jgi:hypothetical protein
MIRQFSKSLTTYRSFSILSRQLVGTNRSSPSTGVTGSTPTSTSSARNTPTSSHQSPDFGSLGGAGDRSHDSTGQMKQAMDQTSKLANEQSANIENKIAGGWNKTTVEADEVDKSESKSFKENLDRDIDRSGKGYQKVNPNAGNTHILKDT